jgi:putative DNA modification/repair radical SAM protein
MQLDQKLNILADAAKYDASCASSGSKRKAQKGGIGDAQGAGICHSYTPDGRCVSLLKILLTNSCIYDCSYCINRVSSQVPRAKFSVEEVVTLTMDFYKRNYIEGLFLSSGVYRSSDDTMEEMVEIARRLRVEEKYNGYIHLKAVAGCSHELIQKAGLYADRLSANIEFATQNDLDQLAPAKTHVEVEDSMSEIQSKIIENVDERKTLKTAPLFAPGGQSTQMIIGATPSSDRQVLDTSNRLYQKFKLRRVYYSAFSPIPDSDPKLPLRSPPLIREHRLYQADWLIRFYGFKARELTSEDEQNLNLEIDPKLNWAISHRKLFPVDVNRASRAQLLRVPGFGVRSVDKIIAMRNFKKLRMEDIGRMHLPMHRIRYFITALDVNPYTRYLEKESTRTLISTPVPEQLQLFETVKSSITGEV